MSFNVILYKKLKFIYFEQTFWLVEFQSRTTSNIQHWMIIREQYSSIKR